MGTAKTENEIGDLIDHLFDTRETHYTDITNEMLSMLTPVLTAFDKYLLTTGVAPNSLTVIDLIAEEHPSITDSQIFTFELEAVQVIDTNNGQIETNNIFYVQLPKHMLLELESDVIFDFLLENNLDLDNSESSLLDEISGADHKEGRLLH